MARHKAMVVLAAVLVIVAAVGCGSSDTTTSAGTGTGAAQPKETEPPAPLTKAQFIAHSHEFCDNTWRVIRNKLAIYEQLQKPGESNAHLFARAAGNSVLPTILFWYDDIYSLGKPKGDEAQIEDILSSLQLSVSTGLEHPYRFHSPKQLAALFRRPNRLAREYGIDRCTVTPAFFSG